MFECVRQRKKVCERKKERERGQMCNMIVIFKYTALVHGKAGWAMVTGVCEMRPDAMEMWSVLIPKWSPVINFRTIELF